MYLIYVNLMKPNSILNCKTFHISNISFSLRGEPHLHIPGVPVVVERKKKAGVDGARGKKWPPNIRGTLPPHFFSPPPLALYLVGNIGPPPQKESKHLLKNSLQITSSVKLYFFFLSQQICSGRIIFL